MRITGPLLKVLSYLLDAPGDRAYGLQLMDATNIKSGTMYPLLHRMAEAGLLSSEVENVDPSVAGRPARTYFVLTGDGVAFARENAKAHAPNGGVQWAW